MFNVVFPLNHMVTCAIKFLILYSVKEMNLLHWNFKVWLLGREKNIKIVATFMTFS